MPFLSRKTPPNSASPALKAGSRLFAIGDIHGCALELRALLNRLDLKSEDVVVFLGDYVDRGPDSKGVVDLILQLRTTCQVVTLKGNHEAMFLDFLERPDTVGAGMFIINGGATTLDSYTPTGEVSYAIPEEHVEFFQTLRLTFETDTHFFVHAGVPSVPLASLNIESPETALQLLWMRQPFLSSTYQWEKVIVHGHTPVSAVEKLANRINLDTGCVFGNQLTALELPSGEFHSVERGVKSAPLELPALPPRVEEPPLNRAARRYTGHLPIRVAKAQHPDAEPAADLNFETLNYNQFGLLMREVKASAQVSGGSGKGEALLKVSDVIEGEIGGVESVGTDVVRFMGVVTRVDVRGEHTLYAVRIERIAGGIWGTSWVERPKAG